MYWYALPTLPLKAPSISRKKGKVSSIEVHVSSSPYSPSFCPNSCCLFLFPLNFFVFLFCMVHYSSLLPEWSHPILTALNALFNADSKQFYERIIFILFNPPLHLYTFPSLKNCRSVPTIAPLPSSLSPCRPLCSLPGHVSRTDGRWHTMSWQRGRMYV